MKAIAKTIGRKFLRHTLLALVSLAAIVLCSAGISGAESPVKIMTPPGLIRVDGLDAEADKKVNSLLMSAPEVKYLAFFSETGAWDEFLAGKSSTLLPSLFAYVAELKPRKPQVISLKDFESIKRPVLEQAKTGQSELLANEPRYITTLMKMSFDDIPGLPQPSMLLTSIVLVEGLCFTHATINYGGPEQDELFRSSHFGWRDAYVNKTGP